jgi:ubiquitin-conjugating enzyme E2 M
LNILREDWKPVSSLKDVMFGLLFLFLTPNPTDPLNKEAAELMLKDKNEFAKVAALTMKGGYHNGVTFDRVI